MKKYFTIASVVLNVALLGVVTFTLKDKIRDILKLHYHIVFYGDSLTYFADWNSLLNKSDLVNSGFRALTTSHFVELLDDGVLKYKPDTCYLMAGINDIKVGIPLERTKQNFKAIVDTLLKHKITPVLQSTLYTSFDNLNIHVDSVNDYLIQLSKEKGLKYINVNSVLSDNHRIKKNYTYDGVHLEQPAYLAWARLLRQ